VLARAAGRGERVAGPQSKGSDVFADRRPEHLDAQQARSEMGSGQSGGRFGDDRAPLVAGVVPTSSGTAAVRTLPRPRTPCCCIRSTGRQSPKPIVDEFGPPTSANLTPGRSPPGSQRDPPRDLPPDDPCVRLRFAPEGRPRPLSRSSRPCQQRPLRADDALGWVTSFGRRTRRTRSMRLSADWRCRPGTGSPLFTENYMVLVPVGELASERGGPPTAFGTARLVKGLLDYCAWTTTAIPAPCWHVR